ncbi:protein timeless homolog isoform X1 [Tribolium castaneum]|uniref:Timeout n=1 Tax=Tribolium castaneum TaxID=7070 RepID=D6W9F2_TRICA|nr:PREDICTED: protein timeless homolog isoform X1 [Tribolium castaneum]EEZ99220.1 timeout [Tribolium castaneum]|eukprot:XP_008201051.1 PREDICTED: protein timeless homolog isoform X1 [Tribolium castaneum]
MSSLLSAELAATCSALGYYDATSNKYYADSNTLETVKDLIRYLRRDDESHDIRRQLGEIKVLQNDLVPLLKSYWEETDLFDVLLRLLVNLTTPALMLWNEELPTDKITRNHYLQIEDHLKSYKQTFADETFWAVLSTRLSKILETSYAERGDENSLIIERILILIRNILYVPPDPNTEKRPDNDASIHDQVLWALHQSGMLDIILFITSSTNEKAYYMHTLEILSFMLREQKAAELARAALQRSETEKMRDEAELLAIRHRETNQKQQKIKLYNGARHSRFGGTYVLKSMKSISDNELIYHKPLNKLEALNFDADKRKPKTPKNRMPVQSSTFERRSAFSIRLFLKEFCVEFLNGAYNTLMYHVKDNLVRARAQAHDESYYLWALRFFMEFNRCYKFEVKLVSETMAVQTFRYVQQLTEKYFDMIQSDKKNAVLWSRRLHLALLAYRELFLTLCAMDKSPDETVRDSARVIKSNIFYIVEYREFVITLLMTYDELKMSNAYLKDLMETQHVFIKLLESFCGSNGSVVVQKKLKKKGRKKKASQDDGVPQPDVNLERRWDEAAPQLSTVLEGNADFSTDVVPFDAASDVPIDEQKAEAMKNVQRKLRNADYENAISLLRAAREVWPENNCFGSNNMAPEEEFLALRDIFFADLGDDEPTPTIEEQPIYDENDEEEDEEAGYGEVNFKFTDFSKRLAHPRIVRACGLALRDFESNSVNTNHCIIKLLHRIAFDCKLYVMIFQVSIFRTFQKIYANKDFPQYRELVKFATYIIRQFIKITEINKKVYMESLFFKNTNEAYEIEHGYGTTKKAPSRGWTEEEEDELRRLFMEHQTNQLQDDVVDWIVNNLIDNTRTRRAVLKKLKDMCLLVNPATMRKSTRCEWGDEEVMQLRALFHEFRDAADPLGCIMPRLEVKRSRQMLTKKLLDLGVIRDKADVRKKRGGAKRPTATRRDSDSESNGSEDDDYGGGASRGDNSAAQRNTTKTKSKKKKPVTRQVNMASDARIAALFIKLVESGMSEALEWLKDSFSDAVEDFENDDGCEGIPLVPIMDYAVNAMENADFIETLKALGVAEPFDEQEMYWRIPGNLSVDVIRKYIDLLQQAVDNTLTVPESQQTGETKNIAPPTSLKKKKKIRNLVDSEDDASNDGARETEDGDEDKSQNRKQKQGRNVVSSDEDETNDGANNTQTSVSRSRCVIESDEEEDNSTVSPQVKKSVRRIIDEDEDEENDINKRNRIESDSEAEKPAPKRTRTISSDED